MSVRKPLVLGDSAQLEQLQANDDLDIPVEDRLKRLRKQFQLLLEVLYRHGISLPRELRKEI